MCMPSNFMRKAPLSMGLLRIYHRCGSCVDTMLNARPLKPKKGAQANDSLALAPLAAPTNHKKFWEFRSSRLNEGLEQLCHRLSFLSFHVFGISGAKFSRHCPAPFWAFEIALVIEAFVTFAEVFYFGIQI